MFGLCGSFTLHIHWVINRWFLKNSGEFGYVKYSLEATIKTGLFKFDYDSEVAFTVNCISDLNKLPGLGVSSYFLKKKIIILYYYTYVNLVIIDIHCLLF